MKVLVRVPNWIGDHVMARSLYSGLRTHFAGARVCAVGPEWLAELSYPEFFDEVLPLDNRALRRWWSTGRELSSMGFDLAVNLPASFRSALLLWAARIPKRVGFADEWSGALLTDSLKWEGRAGKKHKARLYLGLLEWMTARSWPLLSAVDGGKKDRVIVVAPGASIGLREWPYYPELAAALAKRHPDYRLVLVGSQAEEKWRPRFRRAGAVVEDKIGKTSLTELRDLAARAAVVVANDSGVAHLSATLAGAPTVVLFGPGDPEYIAPQGKVVALRENLPCSPCEKPRCAAPYGYQRCLRDVSLERVLGAVDNLLSPV